MRLFAQRTEDRSVPRERETQGSKVSALLKSEGAKVRARILRFIGAGGLLKSQHIPNHAIGGEQIVQIALSLEQELAWLPPEKSGASGEMAEHMNQTHGTVKKAGR